MGYSFKWCRGVFIGCIVALTGGWVHGQSQASESNLQFGGSLRTRIENKMDFNFNDAEQSYALTQFRANFLWGKADGFHLFFETQDARVFGEDLGQAPGINRNATPNVFRDEFDIHRAYLHFKWGDNFPVRVKVGRQKFNLGAQRLVASLEWVNTARVADAVRVTLGNPKKTSYDIFSSRLVAVNPNSLNDWSKTGNRYFDSDFHGFYATHHFKNGYAMEGYYLLRQNDDLDDTVNTVGARFTTKGQFVSFHGEAALQSGDFGGQDHSASMAHLELTFARQGAPAKYGVAYNFGSGDDDPSDSDHGTFDNLYPLNHAYYGFMDFISLQNVHNLEATYNRSIMGYKVRLAYQGFWLAEPDSDAWYNAGMGAVRRAAPGTNPDSQVGTEIDFTVAKEFKFMSTKIHVLLGLSQFFAGGFVDDTQASSPSDPFFYYLQSKISL